MEMYGYYRNKKFTDIYDNYDSFKEEYNSTPLGNKLTNDNLEVLFYLLYANYGNSTISNADENQFKYRLFSTIFQYGPEWQVKLGIQTQLANMNLNEGELFEGVKRIYNHAYNPGTAPSTNTTNELDYINDQNVSKTKRGKLEAYAALYDLIDADITKAFLDKFKNLFIKFVAPERPGWYVTYTDDNVEVVDDDSFRDF